MNAYTHLTDHIFHQILLSTDADLKEVNINFSYYSLFIYLIAIYVTSYTVLLSVVSRDTK